MGCFHVLTIVNSAAMNVACVYVFELEFCMDVNAQERDYLAHFRKLCLRVTIYGWTGHTLQWGAIYTMVYGNNVP